MRERPELPPIELPRAQGGRTSVALGVSVLAHLLLIAIAARTGRSFQPDRASPTRAAESTVDMVYLRPAPPPRLTPVPVAKPVPAKPVPPERVPRPQVKRGDELPEDVATRPDQPPLDLPLGELPPESAPSRAPAAPERADNPAPTAIASATMESESQRLFGPRRSGASRPPGPIPARSWLTEVTEKRDNDCVPRAHPRVAGGLPEMGVVAGIVYREGTRQPLGGAFLQILGTSYSTFADERGAYALAFDKALVDDCRTQYVQVSKDGFAPRRLILALGRKISNDIPMSRR